jgi:VanZ family protein
MAQSIRYGVLTLLWIGMIFVSSSTSGTAGTTHLPTLIDWWLHNGAHFLIYGMLAWLIWRTFSSTQPFTSQSAFLSILVICLALAYGISDEWHQSFTPGREVSLLDITFDGIGAVLGLVVGRWITSPSVVQRRGV